MALIRSVSRPQGTTNYEVPKTVTEGGTESNGCRPGILPCWNYLYSS